MRTIRIYENLLREMRGAGVSVSDLGAAVGWSHAETCDFFRFERGMSMAQAFKVQALFEKRPPIAYLFRVTERQTRKGAKRKQIRINGLELEGCLLFWDPEIKKPTKDRDTGKLHNVRRVSRPAELHKLAERKPEGLLLEGMNLTYFSEPVRIPPSSLRFDEQGNAEIRIAEGVEAVEKAMQDAQRIYDEVDQYIRDNPPLCSAPVENDLSYKNLRWAIRESGYGTQQLFEEIGLTWEQAKAFFDHEFELTQNQKLRIRNLIAPMKPIGWLFDTKGSRQHDAGRVIRVDFQNGHLVRVE